MFVAVLQTDVLYTQERHLSFEGVFLSFVINKGAHKLLLQRIKYTLTIQFVW